MFINKEDKPRADFHRVLEQLKATFGSGFVPLELPLGEEEHLHGIADVLTDQGFEYEPDGRHHAEPLPADVVDEEHRLHDELVEEIVSGDDEQLERYLSGDVPTTAELERTLAHELLDQLEFPVLCGSATTGVGIDRLADFICELGPSPADRPTKVLAGSGDAGVEVEVAADPSGKPLAYVFKTVADQFVGQVSLFKVLSGTINTDDRFVNTASGAEERMHGLFHLRGKEHLDATKLVAGELGAVAKLGDTVTWSTLAPKDSPVRVPAPSQPPSVFGLALKPLTQSDDDKLSGALQRLLAEDPALAVDRNEETGQTVLRGIGDTHVAVALERLARKFGVNVETEGVRVPYRETITGSAEAEGKVKKQSGGHGQYAVANLRVSPTAARRRAWSSSTPSSAARSPSSTSRLCSAASRRRWPAAACTGSLSSTCASSATTASSTPSTHRTWPSAPLRRMASRRRCRRPVRRCSSRSRSSPSPCPRATRVTCSATSTPAAAESAAPARSAMGCTRSSPSSRQRRSSATPSSCAR